jgi:uncharacterized protein YbbK (DUF523 family)
VLVSACLAGVACRYDGTASPDPDVVRMVAAGRAVPICPEEAGGLPTPRPPAELRGGDGLAVLTGRARVVRADGTDVADAFVRGAQAAVELAGSRGARRAVLRARSPSCGVSASYQDGELRAGPGVAAAALGREGLELTESGGE